ncbi:MAG: PQQ-binding-like beta-propeller repeat protein [Leptospiraceae bacterium]|nr:PQQ-binding-like beta-propeller repeat protein [Leptospiraceae bacterium]
MRKIALPTIFILTLMAAPAHMLSAVPINIRWTYTWPTDTHLSRASGDLHFAGETILLQSHEGPDVDPVIAVETRTGRVQYQRGPYASMRTVFGDEKFLAPVGSHIRAFATRDGRDLGVVSAWTERTRILARDAQDAFYIFSDGQLLCTAPGNNPTIVWSVTIERSCPGAREYDTTVDSINGRLYLTYGGAQSGLCALNRGTGALLWNYTSIYRDNMDIRRRVLATPSHIVLAETGGPTSRSVGMITMMDFADGRVLASYPAQGSIGLSLDDRERVVFGDYSGRIFNADLKAGRGIWYYSSFNLATGDIYPDDISMQVSLLSTDAERVYFVAELTNQNELVALDRENGNTLWRFRPQDLRAAHVHAAPEEARTVTLNGIVYSFWSNHRRAQHMLIGVDAHTGKEVGRSAPIPDLQVDEPHGPYLHDGALYALIHNRLVSFAPLR